MSPPRGRKKRRKGNRRVGNQQRAAKARDRKQAAASEPRAPSVAQPGASRVLGLDPLAPVIVRSGRPFDAQSGPDPARFPPPSTIAGCLRTAWARQSGLLPGPKLADIGIEGPLLIRSDNKVLVPKPADALYFGAGDAARCVRTAPTARSDDAWCDLPSGLLPVQLAAPESEKPGGGPAWWELDDLLAFRRGEDLCHARLTNNGWSPPAGERRTHVAIGVRGAAEPGKLFQTEGLDLTYAPEDAARLGRVCFDRVQSVRLLVRCGKELEPAAVHLGGERRLAALQPERRELWPSPPPGWLDGIERSAGVCLTLLTQGVFSAGYRPGWLDEDLVGSPPGVPGLRLQLRAAAVERWQANSGWDMAKNRPRPTCKLAPAGATYWFRILDGSRGELDRLWLASVSDGAQARRDGFGLALPSCWHPPAEN